MKCTHSKLKEASDEELQQQDEEMLCRTSKTISHLYLFQKMAYINTWHSFIQKNEELHESHQQDEEMSCRTGKTISGLCLFQK